MSTSVVTPPAAAAAVAVAKPSHSVRPGSLTCTWRVHQPGQQHHVVAQLDHLRGVPPSPRSGSTATIVPPLTATQPGPRRGRHHPPGPQQQVAGVMRRPVA